MYFFTKTTIKKEWKGSHKYNLDEKRSQNILYSCVMSVCMSFAVMFFKKSNGKFYFAILTEWLSIIYLHVINN